MPMSEEDEVFLERSFQRTLIVSFRIILQPSDVPNDPPPLSLSLACWDFGADLTAFLQELEKLISYSATPTAVWRRTGEVCYANPEFCALLGRSESDLLGKKTFVYEMFARRSREFFKPFTWSIRAEIGCHYQCYLILGIIQRTCF